MTGRAVGGAATDEGRRAGRVRIGGLLVDRPPEPYRPAVRGTDWEQVSLAVRVSAARCESCQRQVGTVSRLQAAHLVAEVELHAMGPGVRARFLLDRRGLVALCRACHGLFDLFTQRTRDVRWIGPHRLARLLQWRQRPQVAEGLRRLARCRAMWLAMILREVDGDGGAGGSEASGRSGGAGERTADSE